MILFLGNSFYFSIFKCHVILLLKVEMGPAHGLVVEVAGSLMANYTVLLLDLVI
ncbi:hypothetical protein NEIELOOT_01959 [Neisseria elongata subsp. glycolytica ATCC 29315]|uniref:Uncharacterized protein n=1 Tax=Neisseria elongata subsp. glycolytica ATCC 29315 TaxID=546263 RepID=D4DSB5_NEIEG|nr:hypothetical protein NEIELOOT_01959 [Neisseria elongata subsp. glycolytica ATCC 29315]